MLKILLIFRDVSEEPFSKLVQKLKKYRRKSFTLKKHQKLSFTLNTTFYSLFFPISSTNILGVFLSLYDRIFDYSRIRLTPITVSILGKRLNKSTHEFSFLFSFLGCFHPNMFPKLGVIIRKIKVRAIFNIWTSLFQNAFILKK